MPRTPELSQDDVFVAHPERRIKHWLIQKERTLIERVQIVEHPPQIPQVTSFIVVVRDVLLRELKHVLNKISAVRRVLESVSDQGIDELL